MKLLSLFTYMKMAVFWDVASYSLVDLDRHFRAAVKQFAQHLGEGVCDKMFCLLIISFLSLSTDYVALVCLCTLTF
jgi:hypothetical protein